MIDYGSLYNLILQQLIKHYRLPGSDNSILPAQDLNSGKITLYKRHRMTIEMLGKDTSSSLNAVNVFGANITSCDMILGMTWLVAAALHYQVVIRAGFVCAPCKETVPLGGLQDARAPVWE